jgi:hypothetical protein
MRGEVVVAKRHQGTPFPSAVRCVRPVQPAKFIVDDHGLLSVDQKHAFLDLDAFNLEQEGRERIETKLLQKLVARWMHDAWIVIGGEIVPPAIHDQRLLHLREQHHPAERRLGRRHQQAMIATRILSGHRRRGVAAETIRFQPFTAAGA